MNLSIDGIWPKCPFATFRCRFVQIPLLPTFVFYLEFVEKSRYRVKLDVARSCPAQKMMYLLYIYFIYSGDVYLVTILYWYWLAIIIFSDAAMLRC